MLSLAPSRVYIVPFGGRKRLQEKYESKPYRTSKINRKGVEVFGVRDDRAEGFQRHKHGCVIRFVWQSGE